MKVSLYNYIQYMDEYGYWYNALTGSYFRLSKSTSIKLSTLLNNIPKLKECIPDVFEKLNTGGFVLPDEVEEIDIIRKKHYEAVHKKNYFLVILPTLNCNFKCWYCIQDHIPSMMAPNIMAAIKNHIEYMIKDKKIEVLHLDWFGGEPFMFFKQIIQPISEFAIAKCKEYGIQFTNAATTNGYYLNEEITQVISNLNFSQFQITLDGDKENHDQIKFMNGCQSAFEHVLNNINRLLTINTEVRVFLRINYTHKTLSRRLVEDINRFIVTFNRNRIIITPKKVWQEKVNKNFTDTLIDILDNFSEAGYKVHRYDVCHTFTPCYVNTEYNAAINFNGNVLKCTASDDLYDEEKPRGILLEDGRIKWYDNYDKKCIQPTFENDRCRKCKKLPICMGLCPRDFMQGSTHCKYEMVDKDFEKILCDYLVNEYDNT